MDNLISKQAVKEIINDIRDCISVEGYCAILERIKKLSSVNPQENREDIHREREQAYMKGYEDASKRYRTEACEDAISRSEAIRIASGYCHWSNIPDELAKLPSVNPKPCEMTAEEYRQRMIQAFHNADADELIAVCVLPTEKEFEHLEWLLKNHYKKEPCDDAISRQETIEWLKKVTKIDGITFETGFKQILHDIEQMPSVSTKKTGRWILTDDDFVYCSECEDSYYPRPIDASWHYCPNCGARMEVENG